MSTMELQVLSSSPEVVGKIYLARWLWSSILITCLSVSIGDERDMSGRDRMHHGSCEEMMVASLLKPKGSTSDSRKIFKVDYEPSISSMVEELFQILHLLQILLLHQ
ncbi:hypothetical protein L2E82_38484 [Cichorium intybus]|uniref:Uncharacterized protein n=1 Tax=Cichorium intybus TaxID=13427 RepID=A0ACB9AH01_CICIN|nr:hypothetical protein L2E82_38484 [Cichorium intybus]